MLEVHQLRQSLNTVRQELSHALYQVGGCAVASFSTLSEGGRCSMVHTLLPSCPDIWQHDAVCRMIDHLVRKVLATWRILLLSHPCPCSTTPRAA